eukprot:1157218-Pelagomonas_calceolata.AAC.15
MPGTGAQGGAAGGGPSAGIHKWPCPGGGQCGQGPAPSSHAPRHPHHPQHPGSVCATRSVHAHQCFLFFPWYSASSSH